MFYCILALYIIGGMASSYLIARFGTPKARDRVVGMAIMWPVGLLVFIVVFPFVFAFTCGEELRK